jgi:NTE family protein
MLHRITRSVRAFARGLKRISDTPPAPPPSVGLALGGGFARGLAHIGVLKVFEQEGIPVNFIAGTSVGAVIGAAYCSGIAAKELEKIAALVRFRDFARWTISRYGLASSDRMAAFLGKMLKCRTFEDLKIPLAVAATDFASGEGVVFRSGPLVEAVRASCAYPGMFRPVKVGGRLLVDGLLSHTVPTVPLRDMGAQRVVAVYLSANWVSPNGPRHILDVIGQCFSIAQSKMCGVWEAAADVVLRPDVRGFSYDNFDRASELIRAGEAAARAVLPAIQPWFTPSAEATLATQVKAPSPA